MNKNIVSGLIATALLTTGFTSSALAHQAGDIIVRAGVAAVTPNESSPVVADIAEFSVSNNTQLGLNFGYMLTDNIGIELLAASPFSHDISLGSLGKIAETKHLPPTLVAQYYFGDANSKLRPYVGVGVNFTNFFDNEFTQEAKDLGMIYEVVEAEKLQETTMNFAKVLANRPTKGIGLTKRALNQSFTNTMEQQLALERELQAEAAQTYDHKEGIKAFFEKRKPVYTGN